MSKNELAILTTRDGEAMPLLGVSAQGTLSGALFEMAVEQRYRNLKATNVEAVYTFPLAPDAVLLGIEFEINGKTLSGTAVEKTIATRRYEDAIESGDSAILLEKSGDGLYTVNLGNLLAGEEAVVRYRYAQLLSWEQGTLRLTIPTTIAPRYGSPALDGLQPHQIPVSDAIVSYPFTLAIDVLGALATCPIVSPTHRLLTRTIDHGLCISLAQASLDRDVVLNIEGNVRSVMHVAQDADEWVALASFCPAIDGMANTSPLSLRLVIDCSGSMGGDSITAARRGALKVVESLRPKDEFSVTRFGSSVDHVFSELKPAIPEFVTPARHRLVGLEADMGGTEMEAALASVARLAARRAGGTVLLITDGEVHGVDSLIRGACLSGLRYFVVGVGSSPSHATLTRLASETGGGYEAVTPGEDIEAAMLRQFGRMRQPRAQQVRLVWPAQTAWTSALPKNLFQGDTVHAFAGFTRQPTGDARLLYTLEDGTTLEERAHDAPWLANAETLARLAAAIRIRQGQGKQQERTRKLTDLAVRYNLVSDSTHYLIIHERAEAEKSLDLPEVAQVRQMLAAGWGGTSSVAAQSMALHGACLHSSFQARRKPNSSVDYDAPAVMRNNPNRNKTPPVMSNPTDFVQNLDTRLNARFRGGVMTRVDVLGKLKLPAPLLHLLQTLVQEGHAEAVVVLAFLKAMLDEGRLAYLSVAGLAKVRAALSGAAVDGSLVARIQPHLQVFDTMTGSPHANSILDIPGFLRRRAE